MSEFRYPESQVRKSTLAEQGEERDLAGTTPADRMRMMWQLAVDAWAMMGVDVSESRLQRDIGRVIRRER